jgi:phosphatidate phosphatase PAH1
VSPVDRPERRKPTPPDLPGVASAIDETLRKLDSVTRTQETHSGLLARVEAQTHVNTAEIRDIQVKLDDHGERIIELERLPRARSPHSDLSQFGLQDDDDLDDYTSPGGHLRISVQARQEERRRVAAMERALNDLREQVDAESAAREQERRAKERESLRAEGAEHERELLKLRAAEDFKQLERRLKFAQLLGGIVAGVGAAVASVIHFLHL